MKKYETPKLDIIKLGTDVITTSGLIVEDTANTGDATGGQGSFFG